MPIGTKGGAMVTTVFLRVGFFVAFMLLETVLLYVPKWAYKKVKNALSRAAD